jgi:hypothetical protein
VLQGIAEGKLVKPDLALAFRRTRRRKGVGLGGGVHDVAQALHRDRGLLKLLPQRSQAKHGLRHAGGEHLKGDEHADGEAVVTHDEERARAQYAERHRLLQAVHRDVVAVGELAGGEPEAR